MYGPPVDLSFKDITTMTGAMTETPRCGIRPYNITSKGTYQSHAMRLNNNNINDLTGLTHLVSHFLSRPSQLGWLDLSFNKLELISPVLCEMLELRVLYLHGNNISNLSEVHKLARLENLHTITLHGNSIESTEGYRNHVIAMLPHLKTLDFSSITHEERDLSHNNFTLVTHHTKPKKQ